MLNSCTVYTAVHVELSQLTWFYERKITALSLHMDDPCRKVIDLKLGIDLALSVN